MTSKVAILIVSFNGRKDLPRCLDSISKYHSNFADFDVYIVDNGSIDGTVDWLNDVFPWVHVIPLKENLGFAGGNNEGWSFIENLDYQYLLLLNQDTEVRGDWLSKLVRAAEKDKSIAAIQPVILQMANPGLVNSVGNPIHFLGFGFSGGNGKNIESFHFDNEIIDVPYASGACVLLRTGVIREIGLFDPMYFSYNEDLDLGWRILLYGYRNCLCVSASILHNYRYSKNGFNKYHWIERNRIIGLLKNYHLATLLVYFPVLWGFEIYMLGHAALTGWFIQKVEGYRDIFRETEQILRDRKIIQKYRKVEDAVILKKFTGILEFDQEQSWSIKSGNFILKIYHSVITSIIFW